jgi:hypothetical protein
LQVVVSTEAPLSGQREAALLSGRLPWSNAVYREIGATGHAERLATELAG